MKYFIKRLLRTIPIVIGVTLITFSFNLSSIVSSIIPVEPTRLIIMNIFVRSQNVYY